MWSHRVVAARIATASLVLAVPAAALASNAALAASVLAFAT